MHRELKSKRKDKNMYGESLNGFFVNPFRKKKFSFGTTITLMFLILAGLFWYFSTRVPPVSTLTRELASLERAVSNEPVAVQSEPSVIDLPEFFNSPSGDLPMRFAINGVTFASGSTDFIPGSDNELNIMASTLRRNPKAIARIEAYVEDTGDPEENLLLSENRAMLIREEIIGRGVEPSRVKAEGRGPRGDKGQAYFVLMKIK